MVTSRDRKSFGSRLTKKFQVAQTTGTVDVFDPRSGISGLTSRRAFACPNLHEWWTQPLTWDAQLLSYWFSRNPAVFQDKRVKLINNLRVVTVLGRPGRGASQVEKSPRLNWATQCLAVAYVGACSPNVSIRMAWIYLGALPFMEKKFDDSSRLDVVEIARVARHAPFQPL